LTGLPFHPGADDLPTGPGAYALLIRLDQPLAVALPRQPPQVLPAGHYLYCGSARGPGGLKARVARHLRLDKRRHWHVDQLTSSSFNGGAGRALGAWVVPDGDECALVAALAGWPVPLPGFGASDCRQCPSHLLTWPAGVALPLNRP